MAFLSASRRAVATTGIALVAGCGMVHPYVNAPLGEYQDAPSGAINPKKLRLAGAAGEALDAAEEVRQSYYRRLSQTAMVRSASALAAATLSGWGIYNALNPDNVGANATAGDTRRSLRLGVALASLYGLRQVFVNPGQEATYAEGYRSITCLMLQSMPILWTEQIEPPAPLLRPSIAMEVPPGSPLPEGRDNAAAGDLNRLRANLDRLEEWIFYVNLVTARVEANADALDFRNDDARGKDPLRVQLRETKKALEYARHALSDGQALQRAVEQSGREIRYRTGVIAAEVNAAAQGQLQNLPGATELLHNAHDITSAVLDIGVNTAADQANVSSTTSVRLEHGFSGEILVAGPAGAGLELLPSTRRASRGEFVSVAASRQEAATAATAASAPPAAASGSAVAGAGPSGKTKRKVVKGAAAKPASAPDSMAGASEDELKSIRDKVDLAIKGIQTREETAKQKSALAEIDKREKALSDLVRQAQGQLVVCEGRMSQAGGCSTLLAEITESLYAARRPVAHALLNFRAAARSAAATPECAALAVLRVAPNDVVRARGGDTVSYVISERDQKSPLAFYQGPTDPGTGATFSYAPLQGTNLFVAKLVIGAAMPAQSVRIVVSDSKGIASQTLPIVVAPALSASAPGKATPPASSSASSASPPASGASKS